MRSISSHIRNGNFEMARNLFFENLNYIGYSQSNFLNFFQKYPYIQNKSGMSDVYNFYNQEETNEIDI